MSAEHETLLFNEALVHEYLIRDKMNVKQQSMSIVILSVDGYRSGLQMLVSLVGHIFLFLRYPFIHVFLSSPLSSVFY
jgi:hypothetical protein